MHRRCITDFKLNSSILTAFKVDPVKHVNVHSANITVKLNLTKLPFKHM